MNNQGFKQVHVYEGMDFVKKEYAQKGLTDTDFAEYATKTLGRPYSLAQIRAYRNALGIAGTIKTGIPIGTQLSEAKNLLRMSLKFIEDEEMKASIQEFLK